MTTKNVQQPFPLFPQVMNLVMTSVESIKQRVTVRDFLHPNDSCPTWKQGLSHYQFVGPEDEFSTCYYAMPANDG